jgi:hypothetical protein
MKAMKSMIALSVMAAAGGANAATVATYDVALAPVDIIYNFPQSTDTIGGTVTPAHTGDILLHSAPSLGGVGTAVLDDSGTLTITGSSRSTTLLGTDTALASVYTINGSLVGGTFTASGTGSFRYTACTDYATVTCDRVPLNVNIPIIPGTTGSVSGSTTLTGGSFIATSISDTSTKHDSFVLSNGVAVPPAVPVPAAAWLFGSGLFSLLGAARRRRTA